MQPSTTRPNVNDDDDDDDSHTTLSQGGTDEQDEVESITSSVDLLASPSSQRSAAPSPAASRSSLRSITSPSTQTLNILSQHDAIGGGNLRYDMDNMDRDASAVTASQQVVRSEQDDFADWSMITFALTKPGPLGMTVRRLTLDNPPRSYTIIKKVKPGSQAEAAGVKVGDIVGARYEEVAKWGKGPRPVAFTVLRKPSDDHVQEEGVSSAIQVQQQQESASTKVAAHRPAARTSSTTKEPIVVQPIKSAPKPTPAPKVVTKKRPVDKSVEAAGNVVTTPQDHQAAIVLAHKLATTLLPQEPRRREKQVIVASMQVDQDDKSPPNEDIVPFCKACQKSDSTNRVHHALCPKHPQFDNSGALEKLELIRRGVELGCEACKLHYQHGRVVNANLAHADNCLRHKKPLRQNGELLCVEETAPPVDKKQSVETSRSKRAPASKNDSSGSSATVATKSTSKKKSDKGKATAKKESDVTKKRGPAAKKASGRKSSSSNVGAEEIGTQETLGSTIASSTRTGRRPPKKRRYEYESDSDSEDDTNGKENTRPSSRRPKRTKFIEKGSDVPLVVETASAKKTRLVTPAPKKRTAKKKPLRNAASKANDDSQLKPNWVPCANPWGPSGYQEGDVVLVSPSGGFTHHETIYGGERFTVSPFGLDSDYGNTHRTPSEGFDVILLTRDPNAEHPWGFTYRRHEFGGACLVTSVDPLSPAASAVYRGNESDLTAGACLRIHDMILSMNGKPLGGMTELGVAVELDVSGRELELVVARYRDSDGAAQQLIALERSEWKSFDDAVNDNRRLDWFEMNGNGGATASPSIGDMLQDSDLMQFDFQGNPFGALGSPRYDHSTPAQITFQNQSQGSQQPSHSQLSLASPSSLASRKSGRSQTSYGRNARSDASGVFDEDDNAWLGCVCGEIHEEPIRVFWIQCDDCSSWYNVAPVCVGFNEFEASSVGNWVCRGCEDSVVGDQASVRSNRSTRQVCLPRGSFGKRLSAVPRSSPPSTIGTPAPTDSKRGRTQLSASEVLEDRKRRRTDDGSFLPLRAPKKKADGTYARPCGRGPPGMVWDAIRGVFSPGSKTKGLKQQIASSESSTPPPATKADDQSTCESLSQAPDALPADSCANGRHDHATKSAGLQRSVSSQRSKSRPTKVADDPRPQGDAKSTCESLAETDALPADSCANGRHDHATKSAGLQRSVSSQRSKSRPTKVADDPCPQGDAKSTCESLAETSIVSPAHVLTKASPPSSSKKKTPKPKKGSRLEREVERGKRMTEDGCLRPNSALKATAAGTYARPRGRGPTGMVWDARRGVYAPPKVKASPPKQSEPSHAIPAIDAAAGREVSVTITFEKSESNALKPTLHSPPKQSEPSHAIPAIDAAGREVSVTITGIGSPEKPKLLPVGSFVSVAERVWIGSNKTGGIGTIIDYHNAEDGTIFYDVKYSLGGKEIGIDCRWVSLHDFSARQTGNNK